MLTNRDFHLQTGNLGYKTGLSFTNGDYWVTNGILGLLFTRLQHILLFRELEFPLKDIRAIINSPDFDRSKALEQQIELLRLKKEHIENLMNFALGIKLLGVKHMDFKAFDRSKLDDIQDRQRNYTVAHRNTKKWKKSRRIVPRKMRKS